MKSVGFCSNCNAMATIDIEDDGIEFGEGNTATCRMCGSTDVEPMEKSDYEENKEEY